jgi:hypothetical protein
MNTDGSFGAIAAVILPKGKQLEASRRVECFVAVVKHKCV